MGEQLRFSMYFFWQIGFLIQIDEWAIEISIPFVKIFIAITKEAKGVEIFRWDWRPIE